MAFSSIPNIAVRGISACVPAQTEENESLSILSSEEKAKLLPSIGVSRHRIVPAEICTSDLCVAAAEKLIDALGWEKSEIDCIVFVTQTPDYHLPATSCVIQNKLGLPTSCFTLDVSLGCSGWVVGLQTIASILSAGSMRRGLLLAGDTLSKVAYAKNKATWPLFGDAGTVTALELQEGASLKFHVASDGGGAGVIIVRDGGFRHPVSRESFSEFVDGNGNVTTNLSLHMDGMDVFSFAQSEAPRSVKKLCEYFSIARENVDCFSFHQANLSLNERIREKLKLPPEKVPYSLKNFGNTSSASIPLTLVTERANVLRGGAMKHIACGFGVGLSWGSVYFETDKICVPELVEI